MSERKNKNIGLAFLIFMLVNSLAMVPSTTKSVNWKKHPDGIYTLESARKDLGEVSGDWYNTDVVNGNLRVKIPANTLSTGNISNIEVAPGSEYDISYKVKFGKGFKWSHGGKLGFGFRIGNGYTGGNKANDGTGASVRLMWYSANAGKSESQQTETAYFRPYIYYKDMPNNYGDYFGKQSVKLNQDQWYTIQIRVKSNTGDKTNGYVQYKIDGVTLLDQAIRWTSDDQFRKINKITFHTFRGGSEAYWQSDTDGEIYYADLQWRKIAD